MHDTAERNIKTFLDIYVNNTDREDNYTIVEIGSLYENDGFLPRNYVTGNVNFIGVDFISGNNVDVVLTDEYKLPFENESIDCIISSSCFEHAEFFWITYLEIMRILKSDGVFYMCAPSNGVFHRYPVDCWRFYPDSANALLKWGNKNGYNSILLEQFTSLKVNDIWEDYVCVFLKHKNNLSKFPKRMISTNTFEYKNGTIYPNNEFLNMDGF
jgi:SAM-dependent methyltransferase